MPFCPNLSNPEVKKQFDQLIDKHGENKAYYLWDKYQGVVPTELVVNNQENITRYFSERFGENSVFIKDSLSRVGDMEVMGYVQAGAAYLDRLAPMDTAYHEAFHLFFRTTLDDAQREQLYKDAVKLYGEPTAEQVEKAKRGQEGISEQDARLLALEEKMAEEFRFFSMAESAPKGMPARIAKFFKNLLAYIKALVGMPLTARQAYRLLESNKIPASFVRNVTQFKNPAFMIKEYGQDAKMHEELTRVGVALVVDSYDQLLQETDPSDRQLFRKASTIKARNLMGNPRTKGDSEVRDYFLRLTVSYADGSMLTKEDFAEYKRLYDKGPVENLDAFTEEKDIYDSPPITDRAGNTISKTFEQEDGEIDLSEHFGVVYDNWYDQETETGRVRTGFRTDIAMLLPEFGFTLTEREFKDDIGETERIYSISRLEQDPGKTLTQKQRILLSRIPIDNPSRTLTGLRTYVPAMEVYRAVIDTVADSKNFTEMLNKLEKKGRTVPMMKEVYNFINNLAADQQASLFYAFNVAAQEFVRIETVDNNGKLSSRLYSPNMGSVIKNVELAWRRDSLLPGGLFRARTQGGFLVDQKKRDRAVALGKEIGITGGKLLSSSLTKEQQAKFAEMLLALGINIAPTLEEAIERVQTTFQQKDFKMRLFLKKAKIPQILKNLEGKETVSKNFFEDEGTTIKAIIGKFVAPYETAKATAFVNSLLKSIYPINTKSRLNNEELRVKNGDLLADMRGTLHHDVGGRTSMLFKLLSNPKFVDQFQFRTLEALGEETEDEMENTTYEEMDFETLLAARLNAWYNGGKKTGDIALDTMGDRKRMVYATIPKLSLREVAEQYGLTENQILDAMIQDEMLLDLNRMRQAIKDIQAAIESGSLEDLIEGYHYRLNDQGGVDYSRGSWRLFNLMDVGLTVDSVGNPINADLAGLLVGAELLLEGETAELGEKDRETFNGLVEDVQNAIRENTLELAARLGVEENEEGELVIKQSTKKEPNKSYDYLRGKLDNGALGSNPAKFLEDFAKFDYLGRVITRSMFRSGLNFTKDGSDYVKRAQLITTPGGQGVLKGDLPGNPQYGLSPSFNASTVRDILMDLPPADLEQFREKLVPLVGEAAAQQIVDSYTGIESTDAQAFITPKHFYEIMQFKGKADATLDEVYERYLETGKWDPKSVITAMKPSYDGTVKKESGNGTLLTPYSDKTSYVVLTRELVAGIPILEELLDRMEAVKEYEGMQPIEVVHAISAQKLAIVPAHAVRFDGERGQFAELVVQEMDSQFLRFPEEVPVKRGKETIKLGHQASVNMLTNIVPDGKYIYNDGLEYAQETTGAELQNMFHATIAEKTRRGMDIVHAELGYDKVLAAETEAERAAAMAEFIPKLKVALEQLSQAKLFNDAALEALAIAPGSTKTALPLGSPSLQGKFDQLLFSIYKNKVHRKEIRGQQMVQFADFGGIQVDETGELQENLKFLTIQENRVAHAEVDIRADFLEAIGIDATGDISTINEELRRIMGYRIPQQGKSSLLIMKIRNVLPKSHDGVIRVPPGITNQMGSDFDVDKMFIMFPELEEVNGQIKKVRIPYKQLFRDKGKMALLDDAQLNQIVFETFEAVASNINHVHETFSPLDGRDLKVARDILNALKGTQKSSLNIFSTAESIDSAVRNMISHRLRGVWADSVLGRNVLFGAQVDPELLEGVSIQFIEEGEETITSTAIRARGVYRDVTGTTRPTDYFPSLHLGSAVDSVKDPLQEDINDNVLTFKIEAYLYARGLTPRQVSIFLNHPEVRVVTDLARKNKSSVARTLKGKNFRKAIGKDSPNQLTLNFTRMRGEISDKAEGKYKRDPAFRRELLQALKTINTEANDLYNLYSSITPFTIDKAGTTAQNLAMFDRLDYFLNKSSEGSIYGGKALLSQILEGDAYLSSRVAWEAIQSALQLATDAGMLSNQAGFKMFRKAVMEAGKGSPFRDGGQKAMLNAVNHHLVTKPGSPLFEQGFLDKTLVEQLLMSEDKEGSIFHGFNKIKEIVSKKGRFNALLEALEPAQHTFSSGKTISYLEYNNRKQRDTAEENAIIAAWEELYFNTQGIFNAEEAEIAKDFAKHLLTNTVVTTGFGPGPRSMINIIPPSIQQDIGFGEHYAQQLEELRMGVTELSEEFLEDFFMHYGAAKYGGEAFVQVRGARSLGIMKIRKREANEQLVAWNKEDKNVPPPIIYVRGVGLVKAEPVFFGDNPQGSVLFTVLPKRSARGRFYEHNLRTEDGKVFDGSLISEERELKKPKGSANNKSVRQLLQEQRDKYERALEQLGEEVTVDSNEIEDGPTEQEISAAAEEAGTPSEDAIREAFEEDEGPEGGTAFKSILNLTPHEAPFNAQAKIARLTSSFAAAGVDVEFVFATLPEGTKGMVEGNIVTLDPQQMSEDTAYHEVGHILIDMLPEAEVRQYAKQVEASRPDLAEMVRAEYAKERLTEFEMQKEILVTAIGLEGAKIERKNPSKLQILINRVLRAIGKLFGITPDAAAVLAERMFAGDIKTMVLNKQFNPRIQQSKKLDKKIDKVFTDAYQNLEKQIRALKYKPESKRTKADMLKIRQLQTTLANMSENKETINGFFTFSEYVHEQVEIAKATFEELRRVKDNPVEKERALELLNKIDELNHTMSTFFNSRNRSKSLVDQVRNVVSQLSMEKEDRLLSIEVLRNLGRSITELENLEEEFIELIAPIVADAYGSFMTSPINKQLDEVIESVRKNRDTSGMRNDPDYQDLLKRKGSIEAEAEQKGLDPKEEWKNSVLELKIKKLQAKKINRDTIIKELTDAYVDKSDFSLWLDPMIYSSEANLQMFALSLNEANFNANRQSIELINSAVERYEAFKDFMGDDTNKSKFYGDLLTVVTGRKGDGRGGYQTTRMLSLVQPFDSDRYYTDLYSFLDLLASQTKRPEYDPTDSESKKAYKKWLESPKGREYSRRKAAWFAENTVPVEGAEARLQTLRNEKSALIEQKMQADAAGQAADAAVIQEYINEINTRIRSSYHYKSKTFMGELAQPNESYESEKYKKIQATPELKEMYDFLLETYKEKQRVYGQNNPQFMNMWDNFSYIAPSVRQSNIEAVGRLGLKGVISEAKDAFVRTDTDVELYGAAVDFDGNSERYLPRYYTNPVNEKDVTRDILSSILMFSHRSNQYVERSKLTGLVNAMGELHKERRVIQRDTNGGTLLNREAVKFKEKFENYAVDTTATTPGGSSNTVNHLMQFIDSAFYGIHKKKLETKIMGMDPNKLVGTANSLAALGSLSFNFLQIGNQAILDNLMISEEAIAGEFFGKGDLAWAEGMLISNGSGISDIGKFTAQSKLGKLMMHFDALVEISDSLGQDASSNKFLKAMKTGNLLAFQGAVEYTTAAKRMLASMKALEGTFLDKNGEVIKNEDGSDANLWDLMIETKKGVELDPRVDKEKSGFNEAAFMAKLRGLYKRTNQVKGNFDASTLSRTPFGAFLMLFKNYFIPGWRKRWGHGDMYHRDLELGTVTRGMYLSFGNYAKLVYQNNWDFRKVWENSSEVDKRNIKRTGTEMVALSAMMGIFAGLMSVLDDDDDDSYAAAFAAYQARRLETELFAYINPGEAFRMFVSPMAAANRMQKWWQLITHTFTVELRYDAAMLFGKPSEALTKKAIYQRDSYWGDKGDRKIWGKIGKVLPIIYGFSTTDTKSVEDKIRFFES